MTYSVDLEDIRFQLFEWLDMDAILGDERFSHWDRENLDLVIGEALKIAEEQLDPGNEIGDRTGAQWVDGVVTVPAEYHEAYRTIAEGGWIGCTNSSEYGGLELPHSVGTVIAEMFTGSNMSLALVILLTRGVGELVEHYGSDELRQLYCEKLYSGKWTGTMCLTEPQAGSDVGASTTRAEPQDDGSYLIQGEKIFITFGDHDLTENVIHAVLARVPGAPAGTKGLSLFLVPKFRVGIDGAVGEPNDVHCASIEHKLGIHGSPTCSMLFGQSSKCQGFLLGEVNRGMRLMFEMMNAARIEVGLQGMAVAAASCQAAVSFAKERQQGRHWSGERNRQDGSVAIIEHPDVRRMLSASTAYVEGIRALMLQTAYYIDRARMAPEADRERFQRWVEILTPVCKAWGSDWGFRVTEWCLQVYGGYGYTKDYPAEQYLRDAKIASIYEGTNGIQALDLVGRKLGLDGGEPFFALLGRAREAASRAAAVPALVAAGENLSSAVDTIEEIARSMPARPDGLLLSLLNAVPFLDMFGHLLAGCFLLEQGSLADERLTALAAERGLDLENDTGGSLQSDREARLLHNKIQTAAYFGYRCLPKVQSLAVALEAGETSSIKRIF